MSETPREYIACVIPCHCDEYWTGRDRHCPGCEGETAQLAIEELEEEFTITRKSELDDMADWAGSRVRIIRRIWDLYDRTCGRTKVGCSDDLELFLADLREALDSEGT